MKEESTYGRYFFKIFFGNLRFYDKMQHKKYFFINLNFINDGAYFWSPIKKGRKKTSLIPNFQTLK